MKKPWTVLVALLTLGVLVGCGPSQPAGADADADASSDDEMATSEEAMPGEDTGYDTGYDAGYDTDAARLQVAQDGPHGPYLTDGEGRALYLFAADTPGEAGTCRDDCAAAWPPLTTEGVPDIGAQVDSFLVGTVVLDDGSQQVTYNGWPLYYYAQDMGPGSAAGHDLHDDWGAWYLVSPQGDKVESHVEVEATTDDPGLVA